LTLCDECCDILWEDDDKIALLFDEVFFVGEDFVNCVDIEF